MICSISYLKVNNYLYKHCYRTLLLPFSPCSYQKMVIFYRRISHLEIEL